MRPHCPSLSPLAIHDSSPKPFLGHFIANVQHAKLPRLYPTRFYVFEDTNSPLTLLSYATSERLGLLEFKLLNFMAQSHTDTLSVPTLPLPGSLRKTTKCVTFCDLLLDLDQPYCKPFPQGLCGLRRDASPQVHFSDKENT